MLSANEGLCGQFNMLNCMLSFYFIGIIVNTNHLIRKCLSKYYTTMLIKKYRTHQSIDAC